MLFKLSTPDGLVISVDEAKRRLRIDDDEADEDLERMLRAATRRFERRTARTLLPTRFEWWASDWSYQQIDVVPVRGDLEAIAYFDAAGVERTISPTSWIVTPLPDRGMIVSYAQDFASPALSATLQRPVRIRFEAGYDDPTDPMDDPATSPDQMDVHAILMLAGHWHLNRETAGPEDMRSVPGGFEDLVNERRIYR